METGTLIITQEDIRQSLSLNDYIVIIENVHALHAHQNIYEPDLLHADVKEGEFHLKTGGFIFPEKEYYGLKINGGFFKNTEQHLPNILGMIYICNARNGYPLALMDSCQISKYRTGAATAVAAKYLAPKTSIQLGVFGYGTQAEIQILAVKQVCDIREIRISGRDQSKATAFAEKMGITLDIPVTYASPEETASLSNFIITTTPSRQFYIHREWVQPNTFIAAIGADSPGKQELDPTLVASAIVVADVRKQVCRIGESQHAIREKLMTPKDIYAELGEIVIGKKNIPENNSIIIYDSTGTALQDIGVGIRLYEKFRFLEDKKIQLFN